MPGLPCYGEISRKEKWGFTALLCANLCLDNFLLYRNSASDKCDRNKLVIRYTALAKFTSISSLITISHGCGRRIENVMKRRGNVYSSKAVNRSHRRYITNRDGLAEKLDAWGIACTEACALLPLIMKYNEKSKLQFHRACAAVVSDMTSEDCRH